MSDAGPGVLITGAGKTGSPATIAAVRRSGYRVIAVDSDPGARGLRLADQAYVVPAGDEAGFVEELTRICVREQVRAVVPLLDEELVAVWELARHGIQILLPRLPLVALCLDRLHLIEALALSGVRTPRTRLASKGAGDLSFPVVLTHRYARGEPWRDRLAGNMRALDGLLHEHHAHLDRLLLQEFVRGAEYAVSIVVWRDRSVQAVVPKEIVPQEGGGHHALTRRHAALAQACAETSRVLVSDGPLNVRARLDSYGTPYIFDIDPRFSSSSALTAAAGVDEVCGLLGQALTGSGPTLKNLWSEGISLRHGSSEALLPTPPQFPAQPTPG